MADGLYLRNGIWWMRTDPVTGKRGSTKCTKKADARAYREQRKREAISPAHRAAHETTLVAMIDSLLESKRTHKAAGTVHFYTHKLRHVIRIAGKNATMADIDVDMVDRIVNTLKAEGSRSIGKVLTALRQVCRYAKRRGKWTGDLALLRPEDLETEYVPRETALTKEQFEALMDQLSPKRRASAALFVGTAGRLAETKRATKDDVDLETWMVKIHGTKTKLSKRRVQVPSLLRPLVALAYPWLPLAPWTNMVRDLARACKRAGVPKVTANDLRRTTTTWLVEAGVDYHLIAAFLGHRDTRMLERVYGRPSPEAMGRLVESQISNAGTVTKTSQPRREPGSEDAASGENASNVEVAQSVEQWTEKPLFLGYAAAKVGCFSQDSSARSPHRAASRRRGVTKNVTSRLPPLRVRRETLAALNRIVPGCVEAELALIEGTQAALSGPAAGVLPYLHRAARALGVN